MSGERIYALVGGICEEYVLEAEPACLKALIPSEDSNLSSGRRLIRRLLVAAASIGLTLGVGFGTLTGLTRGGIIASEAMPFLGRFPTLQAFLWPDEAETDTEEDTAAVCDHVYELTDGSSPTVCFTGMATPMYCERCGETVSYTPVAGKHLYREGACMLCGLTEGCHTLFTVQADPDETVDGAPAGVMLTGLSGDVSDTLILPDVGYLEGYGLLPVTAVGELSLSSLSRTPTEVILPDTVKRIHSRAFYSVSTLERVTLPDGLLSIGDEAFRGCGLTALVLPDGVTALGASALRDCPSLREVHLSASLTTLGEFALRGCPALWDISIPAENTVFYEEDGCLIKRDSGKLIVGVNGATIPKEGIYIIGEAAFEGRAYLEIVVVPESVRQIQDDAFRDCKGMTRFYFPTAGALRLGDRILSGCTGLTMLELSSNIQTIGENMFEGCTALEDIHFGHNFTHWVKLCNRTGINKQLPRLPTAYME